ncbi:MAG: LacI family DNA-binding transcriptional regulator, partial [Anaerolineae bacterium]|nr:LacI family transcriptional regulator [Caldilineales bacterium]MDW8268710.1 LacI family DNA-binding transcriptional regulator [Anaerolineae bacterium]
MAATIRDVAKRAGVGVGTVSRVLNNHPAVSPATREAVEAAIAELNFSPNPSARRLSSGKSYTIGIVLPFFTLPSFVERLQGVVAALEDTPYDVVIYNVETVERRNQYLRELPQRKHLDGLLIVSLPLSDEEGERIARSGLPTVLIDSDHPALSRVVIDDVYGGMLATRHLLELGHRKVAYVSDMLGSPFGFVAGKHRLEGYTRALAEAGIPFRPEFHGAAVWHGVREAR